jgi:hypothetical protein
MKTERSDEMIGKFSFQIASLYQQHCIKKIFFSAGNIQVVNKEIQKAIKECCFENQFQ